MASAAVKLMTADEFLLWQQDKDVRYELVDGIPIGMMAGASDVHDRVVTNVIVLLQAQLRGSRCRPTTADIALRTKRRSVRRPGVLVDSAPLKGDVYEAPEPRDRLADAIGLDQPECRLPMSEIYVETGLSEGEPTDGGDS